MEFYTAVGQNILFLVLYYYKASKVKERESFAPFIDPFLGKWQKTWASDWILLSDSASANQTGRNKSSLLNFNLNITNKATTSSIQDTTKKFSSPLLISSMANIWNANTVKIAQSIYGHGITFSRKSLKYSLFLVSNKRLNVGQWMWVFWIMSWALTLDSVDFKLKPRQPTTAHST